MKSIKLILPLVAVCFILGLSSCGVNSLVGSSYTPMRIITDPSDAQVFNELNQYLGNTPTTIVVKKKVPVGKDVFTLRKDGYEPFKYIFNGSWPQNNELKVRLKPIEDTPERVTRNNAGQTDMEKAIIRWNIDSDPRGARVFWRVISSVPNEVKNTNETYLGTTPYEETRGFNIMGLTYENSNDVTIEIKVTKRGYEEQVKRFNARMALDQQEIGGFFELIEK